jgi:hypothetical protein
MKAELKIKLKGNKKELRKVFDKLYKITEKKGSFLNLHSKNWGICV